MFQNLEIMCQMSKKDDLCHLSKKDLDCKKISKHNGKSKNKIVRKLSITSSKSGHTPEAYQIPNFNNISVKQLHNVMVEPIQINQSVV